MEDRSDIIKSLFASIFRVILRKCRHNICNKATIHTPTLQLNKEPEVILVMSPNFLFLPFNFDMNFLDAKRELHLIS